MPHRHVNDRRKYARDYYHETRKPNTPTVVEEKNVLVTVRLPASLIARVQRLVDEGLATLSGPYRNRSQAMKDLITRGFFSLKTEGAEEAQQYLRVSKGVDMIGQHRREAQASYSRFKVELRELESIGATDAAIHYYHSTRGEVEKMDAGTWRNWWLKQAAADFPKLHVAKVKGVSLDEDVVDQPARGGKRKRLTETNVIPLQSRRAR